MSVAFAVRLLWPLVMHLVILIPIAQASRNISQEMRRIVSMLQHQVVLLDVPKVMLATLGRSQLTEERMFAIAVAIPSIAALKAQHAAAPVIVVVGELANRVSVQQIAPTAQLNFSKRWVSQAMISSFVLESTPKMT